MSQRTCTGFDGKTVDQSGGRVDGFVRLWISSGFELLRSRGWYDGKVGCSKCWA